MKRMSASAARGIALACLGVVLMTATPASAVPACLTYTVSTTSGSNQCTADGLDFTFVALSFSPPAMGDTLTISAANFVAGNVTLQFQINGTPPLDVLLNYDVSGATFSSIDASYGNAGDSGTISETACSITIPITGCPLADVLATLHDPLSNGGANVTEPLSTSANELFLTKDIEDNTANSFSEFTDSVQLLTQVPEPMTLTFLGAGLVIAGAAARRKKSAS